MADQQSRPRPTPGALAGRTDPARRVRPVDWSASGRPTEPEAPAGAPKQKPAPRRPRTVPLPRPLPSPPADAVHALGPEDPRPAVRELQVPDGDIRTVGIDPAELDIAAITRTVSAPEEVWSADGGISDHFLRGPLVVQVCRRDHRVMGVFTRGYALAVRPVPGIVEDSAGAAGRSARRGVGTRVPTSRRELIEALHAAGFEITTGVSGSGHGRITHPDHPGAQVPLASTPSDVRYTRHAVTQIRRVFGIDLRN